MSEQSNTVALNAAAGHGQDWGMDIVPVVQSEPKPKPRVVYQSKSLRVYYRKTSHVNAWTFNGDDWSN